MGGMKGKKVTMDGWMEGGGNGRLEGRERWLIDGWMDGLKEGRKERRKEGYIYTYIYIYIYIYYDKDIHIYTPLIS